jgi:hypothetical protein
MKYANANKFHRKSGAAQWRDLLFSRSDGSTLNESATGGICSGLTPAATPDYGLSLLKTWSFEMSLNITNAAKISRTTKAAW